jgi:hypothetical protein
MRKYPGIPELLEQYMQEQGADERWITVQELRDRFGLARYQGNTVSGFLRRLESGPFGQFPFIVTRIEQAEGGHRSDPPKCRYLVKRKDMGIATVPVMINQTRTDFRSFSSI